MRNSTEAISLAAEFRAPPITRIRIGVASFSAVWVAAGQSMTRLPAASTVPENPGGNDNRGVVLLDDGWAGEGSSHAHPVAVIEAGVQGDRFAVLFEGHRAGFHQGVVEGAGFCRFRRGQVIHHGAGLHADVDDLHGAVLEAVAVLLEVGVVEGCLGLFQPALVDRPLGA